MLKLIGNVGKSIVVDAVCKYTKARVYSYDKGLPPMIMECYHVNSDEYSIEEFCNFMLSDIHNLKHENISIGTVIVYTNLSNIKSMKLLEDYANTMEKDYITGTVIITGKI